MSGATSGASLQAGTCGGAAAPEAVFSWTPGVSGTAIIETCSAANTAFDTVVHVRTTCAGPGTQVTCVNDTAGCDTAAGAGTGSRVSVAVTAGVPVFILVDGNNAAAFGNFQLRVIPPAGTCAVPNVIPAAGGMVFGRTAGASAQAGTCGGGAAPENVYSWTPAASGTATIETCSATETAFNTVLYARGSPCAGGAEAACNNDTVGCDTGAGAGVGSRISVPYTAATPVFIIVDGAAGGALGDYKLTVTP